MERISRLDAQVFDLLDLVRDERMIVRQPERPERQYGIGHGGKDSAQAAGHREPLLDPAARSLEGARAERPRSQSFPALEIVVHADEEVLPEERLRRERTRDAMQADARLLPRHRPDLVEPLVIAQTLHGLDVEQD